MNDGGPAFPCEYGRQDGMTLLDWYAGQALRALAPVMHLAAAKSDPPASVEDACSACANVAYLQAGAMVFVKGKLE